MARFTDADDLKSSDFHRVDLSGSRFYGSDLEGSWIVSCDLSGVVLRGIEATTLEIDSPWLFDGEGSLLVNGVNVLPLVDAELNRRFPGRAERYAETPDGLRTSWDALQRTWAATLERAAVMPEGTVDVSVDGEWSFAQTLRHLVLATDMWLRRGILGVEQPFHPLGQVDAGSAREMDTSELADGTPSYAEVLEARAGRVAMVGDFLAGLTPELLAEERPNPHDPQYPETVRSCLHTILEEEWEHHRYAVRDLDAIEARAAGRSVAE
ncbi:pentapeptide repeat-containing protein [Beutenbergia cavernae DSM 12333]|uniref:Pentapeptide repeat-containing protein n=1 Tax=Beutenbergia cavernae (strain ATCC BAA-8 / DSM 12333 / CCUG 43141 / JCM 11478 / NBRC 16432 / NCIMB 13614 / HKI 0122) TaxID=471853 RepID=C5C6C5_BEUC1|nr:DinB family protein [Beutenbergia cavernae]ACQ80331.1 pentapeptide repeat-containing protein [Beutenbergia cavernae DSM 12333]